MMNNFILEKNEAIKYALEVLELSVKENGTLEYDKNGIRRVLNFNGKHFVVNLGHNVINPINSIAFVLNCDYETYSFNILEKHITNLFTSKISYCVSTIVDFWKNNALNHVEDEELNQLISKLNEIHSNDLNNIISDTTIEKWNKLKKLVKQNSSYDILLKFISKIDFAKTTDEKIIGKEVKSKFGEDMMYVYKQVFINEVFPFYKLLTDSKSNIIFGIIFTKKEIEIFKAIFKFIFKDIDREDSTQYFDRENDFYSKKILLRNKSLENAGLKLLRVFDNIAKQIDNILFKFKNFNEFNIESKTINSNFTDEIFSALVLDMESPNNFEKKEVFIEIISQSKCTAESLNKELNEKSIVDNTISKKTNYKERKTKNFNYSYHRNSRDDFSSFSNVFMKSDSSNLISQAIILDTTMESFNTYVPLKERLRHTYLLSGSGGGKTSLLEYFFYQDIQNKECSKIFFDIMGKSTKKIMQFVDKKDLLLLDFTLKERFTFKINPFNLKKRKNKEISKKDISFRTKVIINALETVLGIEWSFNMKVVLVPCIATLLRKGKSDIFELQKFMDNKENEELVNLGKKSPNKGHSNFFETQFHHEKFDVTKDAIATKIQALINEDETFLNMVIGEDTIDLYEAINTRGKTIIIKLPKEANLLARLIVEMIQEIVKKRLDDFSENEIIDTHIYLDEFQNYVTETLEEILAEARNYKLYVTFAHQTLKQIGDKLEDMVLSCTNIKLIGQNSHKNLIKMTKEIQVDIKQLEALKQGEFFLKVGANEAIKIKTTDKFVNMEIDEEIHQEYIAYQLEHYYTKIEDENIIEAVSDDSKSLAPTKSF